MDSEFRSGDKLESTSQHGSSGPRNLPLEYLRKITNNFSDVLGGGGFGTVYKGVLPNDEMIAVKKFHSSVLPGVQDKQFENEAYHLTRLKHPNIVLLVGWCSETEIIPVEYDGKQVCAEKLERLLCLEYMPKGNLRGYLSDESSGLTWETRYKIIEGICYGLHYLHEESQLNAPIIHMDLKPENILLDNNMVPKIADFGLSRLFSENRSKAFTITCHGTLGYMAPEYIKRGMISTKSDIFSLGVIIIEIVTGERDYPDETGEISSQDFTELVLKNWRNRLQTSLEIDYHQIRRCIQIGLDCVKLDRSKRPTIRQVIKMLQEIESAVQSHPTLTDDNQDYTEEVNGPLYNKAEASDTLKGTQNYGFSKGKKRERDERVIDPTKLHHAEYYSCDTLESMSQHGNSGPHNLPLEYLRNITNNFSDDRLLGEGGFGTVYKGVLPNGETVAVKKLHSSMLPGVKDKQFENEAYHLKRLKHPNIVRLLGWCSETKNIDVDYNGKIVCAEKLERLLCLEYMPKGNLQQYLSDESSRLTWETRYKIIMGICYGLHYLHEGQLNGPIVHMDLKPTSILLDNNMVPKITSFGLSRLFSEEQTKTLTISRDGTLGYLAPEYINRGLISTKSDIFSLGVIIIEIVTGQRDYPDEDGVSSQEYTELVLKSWRKRLQKSLEIDYSQQIRRCIHIGLDCVKPDRFKRPTISQVIQMLLETENAVQSHPLACR